MSLSLSGVSPSVLTASTTREIITPAARLDLAASAAPYSMNIASPKL